MQQALVADTNAILLKHLGCGGNPSGRNATRRASVMGIHEQIAGDRMTP
jgi:hypothetical protein